MKMRKFIQKYLELIVACFCTVFCGIEVLFGYIPAVPALLMLGLLLLPMVCIFRTSGRNWGRTVLSGILFALLFCVVLIGLILVAKQHEWLIKIILWPCK